MASNELDISHDPQRQRFEARVDGLACIASYRRQGESITFHHTGVPVALQGRGIAAKLVQVALDWARAEGLQVIPACSYVQVYMRRHPETMDLLMPRPTPPGGD